MRTLEEIADEIANEKLIRKYLYNHCWLSGCSTKVYPIMIWENEIVMQMTTDKNVFNKFIERIVKKYDELSYGYFWKTDGSCPSTLTFHMKGEK